MRDLVPASCPHIYSTGGDTGLTLLVDAADPIEYDEHPVAFAYQGRVLSGLLTKPKVSGRPPCIVFLHDDGALRRSASGYYCPYWARFAREGYCSLSWDKPGVGASQGDWKAQSMVDRADEAKAALAYLRTRPDVDGSRPGLISFGQGGLFAPKVAASNLEVAFIISVSGAVDWIHELHYSTRARLRSEGASDSELRETTLVIEKVGDALHAGEPYETYRRLIEEFPKASGSTGSEADWGFWSRNAGSNVCADLRRVTCPVLAVFGRCDAHVDVAESIAVYERELQRSEASHRILTFAEANHSLLRDQHTRPNPKGWRSYAAILRIEFCGEEAFARGYFDTLALWLREQRRREPQWRFGSPS